MADINQIPQNESAVAQKIQQNDKKDTKINLWITPNEIERLIVWYWSAVDINDTISGDTELREWLEGLIK